jgi:hypothetical protein
LTQRSAISMHGGAAPLTYKTLCILLRISALRKGS